MQFWKSINENRFVSVSTINLDGVGNSTEEEFAEISNLYRNAPDGYGVIETESGFEYAAYPTYDDQEIGDAEAFDIIFGGDGT